MNIELKLSSGENILLTPIRNDQNSQAIENSFQLIDDANNHWMEVQLINNSFAIINKNLEIIDDEEDLKVKLDKLVLEVIEAEQSGTENTETSSKDEVSPYEPDAIKVNQKQFSLKLIDDMIESGDIDLNPDFQRNFVWNSWQKSRLIESILLRIPLPMFYFSEEEDGKISVVDGLQRLTTIKEFIDNKFPLKNLEYLADSCEGRYYSAKDKNGTANLKKVLDPKYFRWFNMTQISVNVIDPSSPPKVKYDIFRRINTGGKPLNNQEIRNCLAGKKLRAALKEMSNLEEFKTATDRSIKPTRMDDQEVALRFILFYRFFINSNAIDSYTGYMDSSLDDLTDELSKPNAENFDVYVHSFSNAMKNAEFLFGRRFAFRKITLVDLKPGAYKQLINKALFVCWSVLLSQYDFKIISSNNEAQALLQPLAERIENDNKLRNYLSYGTNSKANLLYAFKECKLIIEENLRY